MVNDLKETHQSLIRNLITESVDEMRWNADYFPFTEPSYELEILYNNNWLEVLGSGIVHKEVLERGSVDSSRNFGWASGIGLERFAMLMFNIPDIRLFWSQDSRFLNQFAKGKTTKFQPFSKYPSCHKDIAFYVRSLLVYSVNC
jgi:phenylalanyl-tRNA synthetase alpha chain